MAERSDEELVRGCLAGSEEDWRALVERYAPLVLSVPRRYGFGAAQAEDVFAEVCLALVRSLGRLRDAKALPQWLIRTAARATWEAARKQRTHAPPDLPPLAGAAPPEQLVSLLEEEQLVRESLAAISERCRRLLELLYFTAPVPSYDQVARRMGMPRGSLGPTRRRCLDRMREHLAPRLGGDVSGRRAAPPRKGK
jgi:RNA polymerase sigma factor (sigma-70 family)